MITYPTRSSARILLAEDDQPTAKLIQVGLQRTGVPHHLNIVHDGDQVIAALEQTAADLLLLDLHMPGKNGFEVLEYVKQREHLRRTPVVVFSSSGSADDVNRAYDLHANAYVLKRPGLPELCRTLDSVLRFWLQTAMTPHEIGSDVRGNQSHSWKQCKTEE